MGMIKNFFVEEDLKEILGWLGINYKKAMNNRVIFTGFIPYDEIPSYLSIADVAAIPSHINEAFGMTCIEACAMGLPVIATNDGGIPETLTEQKHIIISPNGNLPILLKDAILTIKNDYYRYQGNYLEKRFTKDTQRIHHATMMVVKG